MAWIISVIILLVGLCISWFLVASHRRRIYAREEYIDSGHQHKVRELEGLLADHIAQREKNARDREVLRSRYEELLRDYTVRKDVCDGSPGQMQELVHARRVLDQIESELGRTARPQNRSAG